MGSMVSGNQASAKHMSGRFLQTFLRALDSFLAQARAEGPSDFNIRQLAPSDGERFVIQYIEPVERNRAAIGLDIRSEANRRRAAETSMSTGQAVMTGPITLVQKTGERLRSMLFLLPVYQPGLPVNTPSERQTACIGWTYAALSLEEVFSAISEREQGVRVVLKDVTDKPEGEVIYESSASSDVKVSVARDHVFEEFGRKWELRTEAQQPFIKALHQPNPVVLFGAGSALSALMATLYGLILAGRERKAAASAERAQLATIVQHTTDAIIGESMDGLVMSWNAAAERLFGYSRSEAIGRPLADIFLREANKQEDAEVLRRVESGEIIPPFDAVRIDKEGHPIDVSIAVGAIRSEDGRLIGVAKLVRDIRDRKAAERQLKEFNLNLEAQIQERTKELEAARLDLRNVLDAVPSMIGYWDSALRNRFANQAYVAWLGKQPGANLGRHISELLDEQTFKANLPFMEAALQGQAQQFERTINTPNGVRHSLVNYLPDYRDGRVEGFYVVVHDVTEITESRYRLAKEQERMASIIAGTRTGTWEWDIESGEIKVNEQWLAIIGMSNEDMPDLTADTWLELIHPEDRSKLNADLKSHFSKEKDYFECEVRIRHKDGGWIWVLDRGQVLSWTDKGQPLRMYGTHQNIEALKSAQAQASRLGTLFDSVLRAATSVSIIATETNGTITVFNAGAEKMLGYSADEMIGISTSAPLHLVSEMAERGRELSESYGSLIEGFRVLVHVPEIIGHETQQWTYVRKDGSKLTVQLTVTTIRNEDGEIVGYLGVALDITERLRQEAALRHAKAAAEAANAAKSVFLANMSHEIRTPMNAVIGATYLLESTSLDEDQRQLLRKVQVAGRSLLGIINDVLDLAKIEAGEMLVESEPFSVGEVLDDIDQLFASQADAKGVDFKVLGRASMPLQLKGDALRLKQILVNLVSNAIKFTQEGSVMVWAQQEGSSANPTWLRLSVRDTGAGIEPEALNKLFKPFTQADTSTTRLYGGTGLGLSIVKHLAEMMGGEVGAESTPGLGSEFWVRLPFEACNIDHADAGQIGALTVALVDDVATDRRIIGGMCRMLGWRVIELSSGQSLLDLCAQLAQTGQTLPDALLVDWKMPEMDGIQTLDKLTSKLAPDHVPAVLVITAHDREEIESTGVSHLADDILIKPTSPSELFNAVNSGVAKRTGNLERVVTSTKLPALEGNWLQGIRILLVDDSEINLDIGRRILEKEGAEVGTCVNGKAAIETLTANRDAFNVVLMDVQMPVMDGHTATEHIRKVLGLVGLPIIALTAGALSEERRKAQASGMNDLLTKPLDPVSLIRTVRKNVELRKGGPIPLPKGHPQMAKEPSPDWPAIAGIDGKVAALRLSGDIDLFRKMLINLFKEFDGARWRADVDQVPPISVSEWANRLHKLKGTAGLLGATSIQAQASSIEKQLREESVGETVLVRLKELGNKLEELASHASQAFASVPTTLPSQIEPATQLTIGGAEVEQLRARLQSRDMSALDMVGSFTAFLTARGEATLASELNGAIDELDFQRADALIAKRFAN